MKKNPSNFWQSIFKKAQVKWALKLGLTAAIALLVGNWFGDVTGEWGPEKYIGGLWCAISAIVVASQSHLGNSFRSAWIRFLGTLLGAVLGAIFVILLGTGAVALGVSVVIVVIACSLINLHSSIQLTIMTLAIVMTLWNLSPTSSPWIFAIFRFVDACLGIIIAVAVTYIWPERASSKLHMNMAQILISIHQLYRMIVLENKEVETAISIDLTRDIEEKIEENLLYLEDAKLEMLIDRDRLEQWDELYHQLSRLSDLVYFLLHLSKKNLKGILKGNLIHEIDEAILELIQKLQKLNDKNRFNPLRFVPFEDKTIKELQGQSVDLETFFVFSFIQKEIAGEILKMDQTIESLYNGVA